MRRLDANEIRRPNETRVQAVTRIRTVVGRRISDTPLLPVWNAVVTRLTGGAAPRDLGRGRMLQLYATAQGQFWIAVAQDHDLVQYLNDAGIAFEPNSRAPLVQVNDPAAVSWTERKITLDHLREKAIGDNWEHALDPTNLELQPQGANQYREAKQARLPELRPQQNLPSGPAILTPPGDNMVEIANAQADIAVMQPLEILRGNRAVEATIRGDQLLILGAPETLAEQRAHRRQGRWKETALPKLDPSELKGFIMDLPSAVAIDAFQPVTGPRENQFVLSGDKYGLTIAHPNSETFVRVVEKQDQWGPDMIPYGENLETQEELFGHAETPQIAYQLIPPENGNPGHVVIVVGPGALIEVSEPAPFKGAKEAELEFQDTRFGGTFDLTIIEMDDNRLVPLPGEDIDVDKLLQARGERRQPDKHTWRGAISKQDEILFWCEFVAGIALALTPFGLGMLEAAALAETAAAGADAAIDIETITVGELPELAAPDVVPELEVPSTDIEMWAPREMPPSVTENPPPGDFEMPPYRDVDMPPPSDVDVPPPDVDVPPPEGEPPQVQQRNWWEGRNWENRGERQWGLTEEEEAEEVAAQLQYVYVVRW